MKVLISGEGSTELGGLAWLPPHRRPEDIGLIESLLRRTLHGEWQVATGFAWRSIRKFRPGDHRRPETRTVLGLALLAEESGYDLLAFCAGS